MINLNYQFLNIMPLLAVVVLWATILVKTFDVVGFNSNPVPSRNWISTFVQELEK